MSLRALERFYMCNFQINTLTAERYIDDADDNISPCKSLNTIRLQNSKIKSIDMKFFNAFPNLEILRLSDTSVSDISIFDDDFFTDHPKIQKIDLTGRTITEFPKKITPENKERFWGVNWRN